MINTGTISGEELVVRSSGTDRIYTDAEINNVLKMASSYETYQELATRLLAEILSLPRADRKLIFPRAFNEVLESLSEETLRDVRDTNSYEKTLIRIINMRDRGDPNEVYELLHSKNDIVGIEQLKSLKVTRDGRSDIITLKYSTSDPAICQRSLELMIDIVSRKYRDMKYSRSSNVVDYFKDATDKASKNLAEAESKLKGFQVDNHVINYYEQTRFIASKREDANEQYDRERANIIAADSVLSSLEKQIKSRVNLSEVNQNISVLRDSLAKLASQLSQYRMLEDDSLYSNPVYKHLKKQYTDFKNRIKKEGFNSASIRQTPKGTEIDKVLDQWMENLIALEEGKARIDIMRDRKSGFDSLYAAFSPMGSRLRQLEREVSIKEDNYLQNLKSLNLAVLTQRSMLISAEITVLEKPIYPYKPDPAKRMMLVAVSFIAGFVLSLAVVIALAYFDHTIKSPANAIKYTKLPLLGAFPKFPDTGKRSRIDYELIRNRTVGIFLQQLKMDLEINKSVHQTKKIVLLSTRDIEGKTFLGNLIVNRLRSYGEKVAHLLPNLHTSSLNGQEPPHEDDFYFPVNSDFFSKKSESMLIPDLDSNLEDFDYLITEFPGLLHHPFPVEIIGQADYVILICRANRVWNNADSNILEKLQQTVSVEPGLIVNGVEAFYLEETIGEIPKKRSLFRKILKRIVSLEFNSKKSL